MNIETGSGNLTTEAPVFEIEELRRGIKTNYWEFWKKIRAIEAFLDIVLMKNDDDAYIAVKKKDLHKR